MYPFNPPIRCRFLRIVPWGWRSHISMRVEAYGCYTGKNNSVPLENAWVPLPSLLENIILNFQSDIGRYRQGDSL